jgi:hypothetical protein
LGARALGLWELAGLEAECAHSGDFGDWLGGGGVGITGHMEWKVGLEIQEVPSPRICQSSGERIRVLRGRNHRSGLRHGRDRRRRHWRVIRVVVVPRTLPRGVRSVRSKRLAIERRLRRCWLRWCRHPDGIHHEDGRSVRARHVLRILRLNRAPMVIQRRYRLRCRSRWRLIWPGVERGWGRRCRGVGVCKRLVAREGRGHQRRSRSVWEARMLFLRSDGAGLLGTVVVHRWTWATDGCRKSAFQSCRRNGMNCGDRSKTSIQGRRLVGGVRGLTWGEWGWRRVALRY